MEWVLDNWFLLLFGGGMIAMHMFGHGGHGGRKNRTAEAEPDGKPDPGPVAGGSRSGQRHGRRHGATQ